MNKPKLERCPFCGEVPVEGYRLGANWHKCESGEVYISCSSPKHEGMCLLVYGESFEQAAEKWNCRTPLPDNKALTCEGCVSFGDDQDRTPCFGCKRAVREVDCYRCLPEKGE